MAICTSISTRPRLSAILLGAVLSLGFAGAASASIYSEEIAAEPGGTLKLDLETGGGLTITGWDRDAVSVNVDADHEERYTFKAERRGDDVVVTSRLKKKRLSWSGPITIEISVPRSFNVTVDSTGGNMAIEDVEGVFKGRTMGGKIELRRLRGEAQLETMGGDVLVADSELDGKVSTMGGRVTMRDLYGNLDGSSMGGNVSLKRVTRRDGDASGEAVVISTMGGGIDVNEAPAGAKLETMGGRIEVDSASRYVDAETMGGDIRLASVDGWVEALTMGGDIEVKVVGDGDGDAHIDLESMGGDIRLTVPPELGFDVDIELAYTKRRLGKHEIKTDLPLKRSETDTWDRSGGTARRYLRASGKIGDGRHTLKIRTVNGDVILEQGH